MEEVVNMKNIIANFIDSVKNMIKKRNIKYGTATVLVVILTLGCFWFVTKILGNFNLQYDVTATKQYSLSPQTIKIVKELKEDPATKDIPVILVSINGDKNLGYGDDGYIVVKKDGKILRILVE